MFRRSSIRMVWFAAAVSLGAGCGSSESERDGAGGASMSDGGSTGGSGTTGGRTASGGSNAVITGGRAATGGGDASGGDATGGRASSGGAAGTASGGTAESGGAAGDSGDGGEATDAGQCREVSRFRYSTGDRYAGGYELSRLPDGFLLDSGDNSDAPFVILDEAGEGREVSRQLAAQNPSVKPEHWFVVGTEQDLRFMNIRRIGDTDVNLPYKGYFYVQSFLESGEALGAEQEVLEIYTRGTAFNYFAGSLDGERVVLGNVEPVIRDPWMVLVSKDGEKLGDGVRVLDTGDQPLINCFSVRGTLHGAIGYAVDRGSERLRIVELDASGAIVQDLTRPETSDCPSVSVDSSGIYVHLRESSESTTPDVYRFEDSTLTKVLALPEDGAGGFYGWFAGGPQPLLARWSGQEWSFARSKDDKPFPLTGSFASELIGSALDGRIFIAEFEDYAVSVATVTCGLAE